MSVWFTTPTRLGPFVGRPFNEIDIVIIELFDLRWFLTSFSSLLSTTRLFCPGESRRPFVRRPSFDINIFCICKSIHSGFCAPRRTSTKETMLLCPDSWKPSPSGLSYQVPRGIQPVSEKFRSRQLPCPVLIHKMSVEHLSKCVPALLRLLGFSFWELIPPNVLFCADCDSFYEFLHLTCLTFSFNSCLPTRCGLSFDRFPPPPTFLRLSARYFPCLEFQLRVSSRAFLMVSSAVSGSNSLVLLSARFDSHPGRERFRVQ